MFKTFFYSMLIFGNYYFQDSDFKSFSTSEENLIINGKEIPSDISESEKEIIINQAMSNPNYNIKKSFSSYKSSYSGYPDDLIEDDLQNNNKNTNEEFPFYSNEDVKERLNFKMDSNFGKFNLIDKKRNQILIGSRWAKDCCNLKTVLGFRRCCKLYKSECCECTINKCNIPDDILEKQIQFINFQINKNEKELENLELLYEIKKQRET